MRGEKKKKKKKRVELLIVALQQQQRPLHAPYAVLYMLCWLIPAMDPDLPNTFGITVTVRD